MSRFLTWVAALTTAAVWFPILVGLSGRLLFWRAEYVQKNGPPSDFPLDPQEPEEGDEGFKPFEDEPLDEE
jgi:hypothetical protein